MGKEFCQENWKTTEKGKIKGERRKNNAVSFKGSGKEIRSNGEAW